MAFQSLGVGSNANDGSGDTIRAGGAKINDTAVSNEMHKIGTTDINADGFIKLSAGKKRHVLVLAG